jgi:hypothetical protein
MFVLRYALSQFGGEVSSTASSRTHGRFKKCWSGLLSNQSIPNPALLFFAISRALKASAASLAAARFGFTTIVYLAQKKPSALGL